MATESGIGGRLGTVLEGFVPGLATMEDPVLPTSQARGHQNAEEVVINMEGDSQPSGNDNATGTAGTNTVPSRNGEDTPIGSGGLLDMRMMRVLSDSRLIIFLIIILAKVLYDHSLGLLVFIGLTGTFGHHNGTLKKQVFLKDKRRIPLLLLMLIMLFFSSFFVYFVFEEQQLYKCLIFLTPEFDTFDLWTVLWCAGITDYILKFITISLKCLVALLPNVVLSMKRKGRAFLTIEQASQLYRTLPPVPLWILYFNQNQETHFVAAYIFTGAYMISKAHVFYGKGLALKNALGQLFSEVQYGVTPQDDQIGDSCPICQDNFTKPIQLHCKHIFCEDCVGLWFDRERTCPMCRAKVADDPTWRDGSTSLFVQFF